MMASEAYAMIQETIEKTYSKEHELFYNSPITPPGTILGLHNTTGTNGQIVCDPASGMLTVTDASSALPSPPAAVTKPSKPAGSGQTKNNSINGNIAASTNNNNGRRRDYVSWSKRETEGLVRWLVAQDNFLAMKRNTAQMLPKLSQHLQLHVTGCCKTAKQCDHKIRNLKKCYKKVKDKLGRLGIVDSVNAELEQEILDQFPYFREFEKIMSDESSYLKSAPPSILTPPKSEEFDFNDMSKFRLMPTVKDEDHESINTPDTTSASPYYNSMNTTDNKNIPSVKPVVDEHDRLWSEIDILSETESIAHQARANRSFFGPEHAKALRELRTAQRDLVRAMGGKDRRREDYYQSLWEQNDMESLRNNLFNQQHFSNVYNHVNKTIEKLDSVAKRMKIVDQQSKEIWQSEN
ncbi:hypothetical protein DV495_001039 [Geotrichum candidum]|nr:hypothetical protein DV495_001039 [Geotrichum candidum]KAF7499631.1 hypothetical protein DV113_002307 [Geotrichum candidum]KAI8132766.1 hypothetical protein DUD61_003562 [Geotrichum candidum]KAI9213219.1 hypothetical protein DS838_001863 [Geotrichum bryndzae]